MNMTGSGLGVRCRFCKGINIVGKLMKIKVHYLELLILKRFYERIHQHIVHMFGSRNILCKIKDMLHI